jgi:glucosamine--fructose-6-phosphate aminotransferase (isomerizing)
MCGIAGYAGARDAGPILIESLQKLEYRGYDSAGIAVMDASGRIRVAKAAGKLSGLIARLEGAYPPGTTGIGHTRWATHGKPSDENAHPHLDCHGDVVVIHNGIIENFLPLKRELLATGHRFASETDTEVLAHLIEAALDGGASLVDAVRQAAGRLQGAHAIVVMARREPGVIVAARVGNAGGVVIGYGEGEMFVASDLPALLSHTRTVVFLHDREVVRVTAEGACYLDAEGRPVERQPQTVPYDPVAAAKGPYKHFMLKEIMEQPECLMDTISGRALFDPPGISLDDLDVAPERLRGVSRIILFGMGTSMHAAMIGRAFFERIARLPAEVDNASEFRYRDPVIGPGTLVVSVAQSGETVDTLEAMHEAKRRGALQITVCNVPGAQSTRIADGTVYIRCGPEIAVASTKTLVASVAALYLLACHVAVVRGAVSPDRVGELLEPLAHVPALLGDVLRREQETAALAHRFHKAEHFLFLGRGLQYPVAMEGALKLKEVSYIHAEGYPAGEMKHGPIALIDERMPVVAIAVQDGARNKMLANIEQVRARDGVVIALATEGDDEVASKADEVIWIPRLDGEPAVASLLLPILTVAPLQLLAYHIALWRGCDVDQPRNLAKTVTVE